MTTLDCCIAVRDCEAEVCENILNAQLFYLDAIKWDFKFFGLNLYNMNCRSYICCFESYTIWITFLAALISFSLHVFIPWEKEKYVHFLVVYAFLLWQLYNFIPTLSLQVGFYFMSYKYFIICCSPPVVLIRQVLFPSMV